MSTRARSKRSNHNTNLLTSVVLVLPLLLFYELGVLFTDTMNGADLLTRTLISWFGFRGFLWCQGGWLPFC